MDVLWRGLPVEVSGEKLDGILIGEETRINVPGPGVPVERELILVIETLVKAENPLIITSSMGRKPSAVPELVQLVDRLATKWGGTM